jgi:hypothetical protein
MITTLVHAYPCNRATPSPTVSPDRDHKVVPDDPVPVASVVSDDPASVAPDDASDDPVSVAAIVVSDDPVSVAPVDVSGSSTGSLMSGTSQLGSSASDLPPPHAE